MMNSEARYKPGDFIPGTDYQVYDVKQGGMGIVYLCHGPDYFPVPMALKTIRDELLTSQTARERIIREAELWMEVSGHPYIVTCWWAEFIQEQLFLILSLVEGHPGLGPDLRSWIVHQRITPTRAIICITAVCRGLQHAYKQVGLVHRDLKPENIFISKKGRIQISDFGLATSLNSDRLVSGFTDLTTGDFLAKQSTLTQPGRVMGTLPYMSPEQCRGETVDIRSDIYALGCILYEMLTGQWVFSGRKEQDFINAHLNKAPHPFRATERHLPQKLEEIVARCLQKDAKDRYQDYPTLIADLDEAFELIEGRPPQFEVEERPPDKSLDELHLMIKARTLSVLGHRQRALEMYDQLIASTETLSLGELWHGKATFLAQLGRTVEAEESFRTALRLKPDSPNLLHDMAKFFFHEERYDEALSFNEKTTTLGANDTDNWNTRGLILYELGRQSEAITYFDKAIMLNKENDKAWHNKGACLKDLSRLSEALICFEQATKLAPAAAISWNQKGEVHRLLGQFEEALISYDQALMLGYGPPSVIHNNRGNVYASLGQHNKAKEDFGNAIQLDPTDATFHFNRGNTYRVLQRLDEAITDFSEAIHLDPTLIDAYLLRALSFVKRECFIEALEDFSKVIELNPNFVEAYISRGGIYDGMRNYDEALADFNKAIQLDPHCAPAYASRGNTYDNLQRDEEALADYNKALEIDPSLTLVYSDRGITYQNLQRFEDALADFNQAIHLDPNFARAYNNRGFLYHTLHQHQKALADYDRAIHFDPNDPLAYMNAGVLLTNIGKLKEALPYLEKAAQLGDPQAIQAVQKVRQAIRGALEEQIDPIHPIEKALEALLHVNSLEEIQQIAKDIPFVTLPFLVMLVEMSLQQMPSHLKVMFEQRLMWLQQFIDQESNPIQQALAAFLRATSHYDMQRAATNFPFMVTTDFINLLEQEIPKTMLDTPAFQARKTLLRQIAKGG